MLLSGGSRHTTDLLIIIVRAAIVCAMPRSVSTTPCRSATPSGSLLSKVFNRDSTARPNVQGGWVGGLESQLECERECVRLT